MWLILFVGSLMTSMASGLYTPICAEGGLPVCATNGVAYLYFENECRLNAYIYKQIYLGQRVPIKTDLENCLLNCHEIVCPAMFKPVCAQQVPDGAVRTVPNACLVNQLICATKRHWKVIGEGPCAPTLKSTPLTDEEYSFTSPPSEDYLASNPEPISTSYIASTSYKGQEYLPTPSSDSSSYAVQDQSQNYIESAPAPVPYATPDKVSVPSTYETPQPALCSAAGTDPLPYITPDQSQNYQPPSGSLPYSVLDQSQSYEAPAPVPVPIAAPYVPLDQNQNYVAPTVSVPVPAPCPYATAPDSKPAPYETLDQSQNYVAPAEVPKSYPVLETVPSPATYEVQPPSQCPAPAPSVVPEPYTAADQNQNFVSPVPAPAPYMAQDPVPASYGTQQPPSCPYGTPTPAPTALPYAALDQSLNYVVPVAQDSDASQYEAQKSAPAPCSATDQSPKYIEPAPAPLSYQGQEPVPSPYEAPCSNANSVPAPAPAPYSSLDQGQSYVTGLSAPAPYATQNANPAPYEAEQTALYPNAAGPDPPTQPVYTNPAAVPISSPYDVPQPAPSPCTEETPAYAPPSYAAVEQNPAPYIAPNPVVAPNDAQQTAACPYATSASLSDPAAYTAPVQTQSYDAPLPVPVVCAGSDPTSAHYEAQQPSPNAYPSPAVAPVPATLPYSAPEQSQSYAVQPPAAYSNIGVQSTVPYSPSTSYTDPAPYTAAEQPQNYVAPAPSSYSSTYPDPAPAAAPCEIQQPASYTPSAPALTPTPYVGSEPVPAPAPYEQPQPAPYPYIASDSVQVPYEAQQPTLCAASVSAPTDLSYTGSDQSQSYLATPPAPISASYANPETTPAYQAQPPAPCSCTAANHYSESRTPLLSNIYSRLPGSLDLTKLFKQLRRRFGMFVYQPRYTHIIISD